MKFILEKLSNVFKYHKSKLFAVLAFAILFGLLMFPFSDLNDLVSQKIYEGSQKQVYVEFDDMSLALLPGPGVHLESVRVEPSQLPSLKLNEVTLSPWILGLISFRKGFEAEIDGLFNGAAQFSFREGSKIPASKEKPIEGPLDRMLNLSVSASQISVEDLATYLRSSNKLNFNFLGAIESLSSQFEIDPTFQTQPVGALNSKIKGFVFPAQSISIPMGGAPFALPMPELKLGSVNLQSKLSQGQVEVQELKFGSTKDSISGQISGTLGLRVEPNPNRFGDGPQYRTAFGDTNIRVDLEFSPQFYNANKTSTLGILFELINQFKKDTPKGGARYVFNLKWAPGQMQPTLSEAK